MDHVLGCSWLRRGEKLHCGDRLRPNMNRSQQTRMMRMKWLWSPRRAIMLKQVFAERMERQFKRNSYSSTTCRLKKTMRETISSNCRQGYKFTEVAQRFLVISHVPEILNQGSLLGGVKAGQRGGRWELENVVLVWYTLFEVFRWLGSCLVFVTLNLCSSAAIEIQFNCYTNVPMCPSSATFP